MDRGKLFRIYEILAASSMRMIYLSNMLKSRTPEISKETKDELNRWIEDLDEGTDVAEKLLYKEKE